MSWSITESGLEAPLDAAGRGQVSFVVQNVGTAQDRAMLVIDPLDGAAAGWFTVANPQQTVKPSESVTYVCQVAVPPGTPPATYAFQARAYSADGDSSETAVTSRRVTFTVALPPVQPKPRPWWPYALAAAVLVIVIGVVVWLITRDPGGTTATTDTTGPTTPASQPVPTPTPTTSALSGTSTPTIVIASGGPPVVGGALQATPGGWTLPATQLTLTYQWQRCDPAGNQCGPIAGATAATYTATATDAGLTLRVEVRAVEAGGSRSATARSGPTAAVFVLVPNVLGLTLHDAILTLTAAGFTAQEGTRTFPPQCPPQVTAQDPPAGTPAPKGLAVTIILHQRQTFPPCPIP